MEINRNLAEYIAKQAVAEPYRQSTVMDTNRFARFIKDHGVDLSWRALHQLAQHGVLHPILVFDSIAINDSSRYFQVDVGFDVATFVDLGRSVEAEELKPVPFFDEVPDGAAREMLWHPFQLWETARVARSLEIPIALEGSLADAKDYQKTVGHLLSRVRPALSNFANDSKHAVFLQVLGVLLTVEPLVITAVDTRVKLDVLDLDEGIEGYFAWREHVDPVDVLTITETTVDVLKDWHRVFALEANIKDPVESWRTLIRFAPRDKRTGFRGDAAMAEELYYASEVLRRFLEGHLGTVDMLEEDDVRYGAQGPFVKERLYGNSRTIDFDRSVFRQVVRQYHLDPQPRFRWLLEGATEEAFVYRFAKHQNLDLTRMGVEIINIHGLGGLEGERVSTYLRISSEEEVFAYVTIDHDKSTKNPRILQKYAGDNLLPAGFNIYEPDFEEANFTLEELAIIANALAHQPSSKSDPITAEEIQQEINSSGKSVGDAIMNLSRRPNRLWYLYKGPDWGKALADFAYANPNMGGSMGRERNIVHIFTLVSRAQTSNYRFTILDQRVDECGNVVSNKTV